MNESPRFAAQQRILQLKNEGTPLSIIAYQINSAIVDLALRQLRVAGAVAPLGARGFDLLVALAERHDRVVSKAELLAYVWPGVVVEENNLATQVSALRKVLGAETITTIPGLGYRLTADVGNICETLGAGKARSPTAAMQAEKCEDASMRAPGLPLVGRDQTLIDLAQLLEKHRLVSVLGAGGIGKTVLAMAMVRRASGLGNCEGEQDGAAFAATSGHAPAAAAPNGPVHWVALAALSNVEALRRALIGLWLPCEASIGRTHMSPAQLVAALPTLPTGLVVLDNAEHLLFEVAEWVDGLLTHAPQLRFLVTSQAPLRLSGEQRYVLGPLPCPPVAASDADAEVCGAMQLFRQAAEQHTGRTAWNASAVSLAAQVCRALQGHPLALKLAAARLPMLGLSGLASALTQRLELLATGPSPEVSVRHQSLAAALKWSFELLDASAQRALGRLALTSGDCSLQLAGWLCASAAPTDEALPLSPPEAIELLAELVDRSFVEVQSGETLTYSVPETARMYLLSRLKTSASETTAQQHHAAAVLHCLRDADTRYWSLPDAEWLTLYAHDIHALRAALDNLAGYNPPLMARLLGRSSFLFLQTGTAHDGRNRWTAVAQLLEAPGVEPDADLAHFHLTGARLHWGIDTPRMLALADQALQLFRTLSDRRGQYLALRCSLGSGLHTEPEARELLAEMKRLEDPRWPPRLRAQYLLAQIDHLAQAGADEPATLKQLRTTRETLKRLSLDAGLDTLAVLARVGLADSALLDNAPHIAVQRCRNLLADAPLYGNQRLQVLATLAAAQLAQTQTAEARATLDDFATFCSHRDWEWFDRYADLFTLLAAQEGQAALAQAVSEYADQAAEAAGGRNGPSWQRLYARVQQALAALPPADPIAEPPSRPVEICRELKLGQLD